ncbi:MAG: hypothetical protein U0165_01745 [Polyangiaceae bacterium]
MAASGLGQVSRVASGSGGTASRCSPTRPTEETPDRLAARVNVKPGWNRLVVKVCGDDAAPMVQVRLADSAGAPTQALTWSSSIEHANDAAAHATKPAAQTPGGAGIKVVTPTKGDPYAHGAMDAKNGPSRVPPPFAGALFGLDAIVANNKAPADQVEAFARYLAMTGGDDRAKHTSRDLATRVGAITHPPSIAPRCRSLLRIVTPALFGSKKRVSISGW